MRVVTNTENGEKVDYVHPSDLNLNSVIYRHWELIPETHYPGLLDVNSDRFNKPEEATTYSYRSTFAHDGLNFSKSWLDEMLDRWRLVSDIKTLIAVHNDDKSEFFTDVKNLITKHNEKIFKIREEG